jgi:hypothetical protein
MKKQEFDKIENVFNTQMIPNTDDMESPENTGWWKKTYHSLDKESSQPEMYNHKIVFDGTKPLALVDIYRGRDRVYLSSYFVSLFKQRKNT